MLFALFLILFIFVCIGLIFLIIIQSDKGGGISGAIGGGLAGANTLLGTQDASNILTKGTTGFAITYMALCIVLSLFLSRMVNKVPESALAKRAASAQQEPTPSDVLQGGGLPLQQPGGEGAIPPVGAAANPTPMAPAPAPLKSTPAPIKSAPAPVAPKAAPKPGK
jgi:preprotein translocase subunit SecG